MKKATTLRFVVLCLTLTLCVLAQHPRAADAAACPPVSCGTIISECIAIGCGIGSITADGSCTLGAVDHGLFIVRCSCPGGSLCYR
jgi:hypothetical protein